MNLLKAYFLTNFNPIIVRFKLHTMILYCGQRVKFQSYNSSIQTIIAEGTDTNINYFNPIIVRFKLVITLSHNAVVILFQSYNSSIQTLSVPKTSTPTAVFQSYNSSIQTRHTANSRLRGRCHFNPIIVRFKPW